MPIPNIEKRLETLKEIYQRLSQAYRRGDFEKAIQLTTKNSLVSHPLSIFVGDTTRTPFRDAAMKLFEKAQELDESYKEEQDIPIELKERLAKQILQAQNLSYEIFDYFLITDEGVAGAASKHVLNLTREASKGVEAYYDKHYDFVVTPRVKEAIVKELVLGALSGVNALYRSYSAAKYKTALENVQSLIEFLETRFAQFCGRHHTAFGLLGLGYFLKGRLLLNGNRYDEANDCFRMSTENYVRKLPNKGTPVERRPKANLREKPAPLPAHIHRGTLEVVEAPVGELLALRRAALVLAFGNGYLALISSRVKEAISFLIIARGILHFNSPSVHSAYTELLYRSAKRAEGSNNSRILEEAKKGIEDCRKVFEAQVPNSHYPHRASIELSLVLHYLAQQHPAKKSEYYRRAIADLEAAVEFAKGDGQAREPNTQLYTEACYILSYILRYQSMDIAPLNAEQSVEILKKAFRYAKEAEAKAEYFPRHKCEALLALCGVYAEVAKREIRLSEIDPQSKPHDSPSRLSRNSACKALEINDGANHRISGICYLRLVDFYLKNPNTYSRAKSYWDEWLKIKDSIEHAFVNDWAQRIEEELNKVRERSLVIDFEKDRSINELRDTLNASFARRKIIEWVQTSYGLYKRTNRKRPENIVRRREPGVAGRDIFLKTDLEKYLVETLRARKKSEVTKLIEQHDLLSLATDLMLTYLD